MTVTQAGRTVLFSAATVACAMATLTLFPLGFRSRWGSPARRWRSWPRSARLMITPALLGLWGPKLARRPGADVAPVAGTASPTP